MTDTKVTIDGLEEVNELTATDLIFIGSKTDGYSRTILRDNFIQSIGNPAIDGYNCEFENDSKYRLTSASGNDVTEYKVGMTVSFIATGNSVGAVLVRISNLAYKSMLQLGTATTSVIVAGGYYEAVLAVDGNFYQTNVQSAALPTVTGYNATSDVPDVIRLNSANGINLGIYYNGMTVKFISPIDSTGIVNLHIDSLGNRAFYKYNLNTPTSKSVQEDEYYEAIYIGNAGAGAFYHTNAKEATIYTNEYSAVGTVALDGISTTYQLTSAIGAQKTAYYKDMSLLFTADISSKGVVFVNVDGLGNKVLGEGANDPIANNLYTGQPLLCTYDGTEFLKHRFAVINPPAPPIEPEEPIPDENLVVLNVGPTRPIKNISRAIASLVVEFGINGGNRLATIHLDADYVWNSKVVTSPDADYSWITITNSSITTIDMTNFTSDFILVLAARSTSPIISGTFNCNAGIFKKFFTGFSDSLFIFKNATFNTAVPNARLINGASVNIDNLNTNGFSEVINQTTFNFNSNIISNCVFLESTNSAIETRYSNTTLNNCVIETASNNNTLIKLFNCQVEATDCTFKSDKNVVLLDTNTEFTFKNCRVNSILTNQNGLVCQTGATGVIDGGDYRTNNNSVIPTNIVADGVGTVVRLANNPLGGTSTVNNGQIITI